GDGEVDRVPDAGRCVGVEDGLAERAGAAVVGVGDREGRQHGAVLQPLEAEAKAVDPAARRGRADGLPTPVRAGTSGQGGDREAQGFLPVSGEIDRYAGPRGVPTLPGTLSEPTPRAGRGRVAARARSGRRGSPGPPPPPRPSRPPGRSGSRGGRG